MERIFRDDGEGIDMSVRHYAKDAGDHEEERRRFTPAHQNGCRSGSGEAA